MIRNQKTEGLIDLGAASLETEGTGPPNFDTVQPLLRIAGSLSED